MHSAKRYLLIALSFALALTVFAAFTPKIAHALTATLVQVVNTASNPIPVQDVNYNARHAVELHCNSRDIYADLYLVCNPNYVVPDGKRLVVESVSTNVVTASGTSPKEIELKKGATSIILPPLTLETSDNLSARYAMASNFRAYADAGEYITLDFFTTAVHQDVAVGATVTGYLVDCGNEGCSPLQ